ncbi:MAG: antiporter inner membrane protein [Candidatus Bathyarchaeota archaeon BA1]|nr:MAG: antiporter inner membrane protein [Candidatus Bathyarchaeota archaeon BA1]
MGKVIAIHSSRGGTGKSLIAVNLAMIWAREGRNVALFDLDFRAPSLFTVFRMGDYRLIDYWMNDFLDGRCSIGDVLKNLAERYGTEGKFLVGLANPSIEAVREVMGKDKRWEMRALQKLIALKPVLLNEMSMDYAIYDTSPGITFSSVNAVVSSDFSVVVATMDVLDMEGTRRMINDVYGAFGKKSVILMNKVPIESLSSEEQRDGLSRQLSKTFAQPIVHMIPCYCDVLRSSRESIFVLERPEHPFTKYLYEMAERLEGLPGTS